MRKGVNVQRCKIKGARGCILYLLYLLDGLKIKGARGCKLYLLYPLDGFKIKVLRG